MACDAPAHQARAYQANTHRAADDKAVLIRDISFTAAAALHERSALFNATDAGQWILAAVFYAYGRD